MAHLDENGNLIYDKISSLMIVQANYLASMQDKYWVDDFISIGTAIFPCNWGTPGVSHTEGGIFVDGELWFFSSTSRNELGGDAARNGTRWIRADKLLRHPDRWLMQVKDYQRAMYAADIAMSIHRANKLIWLPYDFAGVSTDFIRPGFIYQRDVEKLKAIYCSKAVRYMWTGEVRRASPRAQFKDARKRGFKVDEEFMLKRYLNQLKD